MSTHRLDPSQLKEIRAALADHLVEAQQLLQSSLGEIDLDESLLDFPEDPSDEYLLDNTFRRYSLIMRKLGLHIAAALRAHEQGNLHSLGVQTKVLIECAAEIASVSRMAAEKTPEALGYVLNNQEHDTNYWLLRLTKGDISREELRDSITRAREGIGLFDGKQPTRVNLSDRVSILTQGHAIWAHLNDSFCHTSPERLKGLPGLGGVMPAPEYQFDLALADVINCASHYVGQSLMSYGIVKIVSSGDHQLFDDALKLFEKARETAAPFREMQKQIIEGQTMGGSVTNEE